jgi:hypothetical protein
LFFQCPFETWVKWGSGNNWLLYLLPSWVALVTLSLVTSSWDPSDPRILVSTQWTFLYPHWGI